MVERNTSLAWAAEPPIRQLRDTLIERRWLIVGPAIVSVMLALAWLRTTPPEYRAFMVVGPTETLDRVTAGDGATGSSGGGAVTDFTRFLSLSTSVSAAHRLVEHDWVLPALFPESWNGGDGRWYPPRTLDAQAERWIDWLLGRAAWRPPGPEALAERLEERLGVGPIGGSGLRRIGLRHRDRTTALRLLSLLHATADEMVRETAAARADAQIAYLRERLAGADLIEHRRALETLLMDQERRRMLIQADIPYAAFLLERPSAPTQADWPNPILVVVLATGCGVFVGLFFSFAAEGLRAGSAQ